MRDERRAKTASGGFPFGSPQFGWRAEGRELVAELSEQRVVRLILRRARRSKYPHLRGRAQRCRPPHQARAGVD